MPARYYSLDEILARTKIASEKQTCVTQALPTSSKFFINLI